MKYSTHQYVNTSSKRSTTESRLKQQLDVRRLLCPLPVIRVQDRINTMTVGELLEVVCTDPGAASDVPAWCRINGHKVVEMLEQDGELVILIEVGERAR